MVEQQLIINPEQYILKQKKATTGSIPTISTHYRLLLVGIFLSLATLSYGQDCGCQNCPLIIPSSTTLQVYELEYVVSGLVNNDLANANQQICEVNIRFEHDRLQDLEIFLVSPSGEDTVQLIGPALGFGLGLGTPNTTWDVGFVDCNDLALHPDHPGLNDVWDNGDPGWSTFFGGHFTGDFYPTAGNCLGELDSGPVNGTWKLIVVNHSLTSINSGRIFDFSVRLCDQTGLDCCFANGGNLVGPPQLLACEGSDNLLLARNLIAPTYPGSRPDTANYGYTYLIVENDNIIGLEQRPDLRGFAPGQYTIKGLSYNKDDLPLPIPTNGSFTLTTLADRLDDIDALFCGSLSTDELLVTISSPPDIVVIDTSICQGDTFTIGNSTFFEANTYIKTIPTANGGCDSTIQIILSVIPRDTTEITSTICHGESYSIGTETFSVSGSYEVRLSSAIGCDSIIQLELTVLPELVTTVDTLICAGRSVTIGEQSYTMDGTYQIPLTSVNGCDSLVILNLSVRQFQAVINPQTPTINCRNPILNLNSTTSSSGPDVTYTWSTSNGNIVSGNTEAIAQVDEPGTYTLLVRDTRLGCEASKMVSVSENISYPTANAGLPDTLTCANSGILLNPAASTSPDGMTLSFSWLSADGTPMNGSSPLATVAGEYTLIATIEENGCTDTARVQIAARQETPIVVLPATIDISCTTGIVMLDGSASVQGPQYDYDWTTLNGSLTSGIATPIATANRSGTYTLFVTDNTTGCTGSADVVVVENCIPTAIISASSDVINCTQPTVTLSSPNAPVGAVFRYEWRKLDGEVLDTTLSIEVNERGTYIFQVRNTLFNQVATDTIIITEDVQQPLAEAGTSFVLTCNDNQATLDGRNSSQGDPFIYVWTTPNGNIISGNSSLQPSINASGMYFLQVTDTRNGCTAIDSVRIEADANAPMVCFDNAAAVFPCGQNTMLLTGACSNAPAGLVYSWSTTDGQILSGAQTDAITIDRAGTYLLRVDNPANGCSTTSSLPVRWENCTVLISTAVSGQLTCATQEVTLTGTMTPNSTSYRFRWTTTDGNITGNPNQLTTTVNAPGTYTLMAEDTLRGAQRTTSIVVEQDITPPQVDAGTADTLTCRTTSIVLGGSGANNLTFQWTANNGQPIQNSNILQAVVQEPGIYYLQATSRLNGCSAIDSVEVFQTIEPPIANAGVDVALTCTTTMLQLDGSNSSSGAAFTYAWRGIGGGRIDSGMNTLRPEISTPGRYILTVTNETTGCPASDTVLVAANNQLPQIDAGENTQLTCTNPQVELNGTGPSGVEFEIVWRLAGSSTVLFQGTYQPIVFLAGTYELQVRNIVTGCVSIDSIEIVDSSNGFTVEIPEPGLLSCSPTGLPLTTITSSASNDYIYQWESINGDTVMNAQTATANVFVPGEYIVLVTNAVTGCTATASVLVELNGVIPTAFAGVDTTLTCTRTSVQLRGRSDLQTVNFSWADSLGNTVATTANFMAQQAGTYILTARNPQNNCSAQDTVRVLDDTAPPTAIIATATGNTISCDQTQLTLDGSTSQPSGNLRYRWTDATATNLGSAAQIQVSSPGMYFLQVTNLANGCVNTDTLQVERNTTPPTITIVPPAAIPCFQSTIQLDASGSSQENVQFVWTNAAGDTISRELNPVVAAGIYTVVATNYSTGCTAQQTVSVLNATPPAATITNLTGSDLDCNTSTVEFSSSGSATGTAIEYAWLAADRTTLLSSATTISLDEPGLYFLQVLDTSTGCMTLDSILLEEDGNAIEEVAFTVTSPTCSNTKSGRVRIDNIIGGTEPILLSWNDGPFFQSNTVERLEGGSYHLVLQDAAGCEWDTTVLVEFPPVLEIDLGIDQYITVGDSVLLQIVSNQKLSSVTWVATDTMSCSSCFEQIVHPTQETTYTVYVEDENGCTATDRITIRVNKDNLLYIPNAFSPNGDGNNDVFFLSAHPTAIEEIESLQIFDRWGMLVFQQQKFKPNDAQFGWDGTFEGTTLNPAVFVYQAKVRYADGRVEVVQGDVALLR